MAIMTLTRAGELPDDWTSAVAAAIRRTDPSLKDFHWLWADTWKDVLQRLEELRDSQLSYCPFELGRNFFRWSSWRDRGAP